MIERSGVRRGWSPLAVRAFETTFRPWMRRRLHAVRLAGLPDALSADRPLLLVANHTSWWDGFVLREVQRALRPRAPLYTTMTGAELRRFPFFRALGALDVGPHAPATLLGTVRFLLAERARRCDLVLSIFPQGRMWPTRRRPLDFRRGVATLARLLAPAHVLPVAIAYELFASPAPTAFVSVGEPIRCDGALDLQGVERAVSHALDRVETFLVARGERAIAEWS